MNNFTTFLCLLSCATVSLFAASKAKIDVGPAFVHLDVLESGKTVERMDMGGIRADASYIFDCGTAIRPQVLYTSNQGYLFTTGVSIGQYLPLNDEWSFLPNIGVNYSYLRTTLDLPTFGLFHLKERFRSISPYLGFEVYYAFNPEWRVCASIQYAWSRTHTDIEHLPTSKSHCQGPNYSLLIEKDLNKEWSLNLGMAYNISLSKEKHGIRGTGFKIGLARWF